MTINHEPGRRTSVKERKVVAAEYARRYAAGESIRNLAISTGASYGTVHNRLAEAGVTFRRRGGPNRVKR